MTTTNEVADLLKELKTAQDDLAELLDWPGRTARDEYAAREAIGRIADKLNALGIEHDTYGCDKH